MPHEIGFVQNTGVLAHYMMLDKIKTFAEANGYTVLRYDTVSVNREVIMKAPGYSGTEEIFMGFQCYQNSGADYYNISCAVFTGYVSGNTFATQPGAMINSVPAHNNRIDYWLTLTPQRIAFVLKVGTPVYEPAYVGKMFPWSSPAQYPYPVVCAATLSGSPATRFSDTAHQMPYVGSVANCNLRSPGGLVINPQCHPYNNVCIAGTATGTNAANIRDTNDVYPVFPVSLMTASDGLFGELEGIFYVSGFNNVVENTFTFEGDNYVVFQNIYRTGFTNYFAMRMDA